MIYLALVDVHSLLLNGQVEQATAIAEAYHNLPLFLYSDQFSFVALRAALQGYREKYGSAARVDYVAEMDRVAVGDSLSRVTVPGVT